MPPIPILRYSQVIRAFERLGWTVKRQGKGHTILTKPGYRTSISIPNHREIARGLLRGEIGKAGLTVEEFLAAVDS